MRRTLVIGDPQGSFAAVMAVLGRHGALAAGGDGLAEGVALVSIGDHFDYDLRDPVTAGAEGLRVLRWLAAAPGAHLLLGNHDLARVTELASLDDESFAAARALAAEAELDPAATARVDAAFRARFPAVGARGLVGRDYASFSVAQRRAVQALLLAGRFHLALVGDLPDGRRALLTHAGVTTRELALLGLDGCRDPDAIAAALEARLAAAVAEVRGAWERGEAAALSLAPLHVAGADGEEGGGLLYHRPANPALDAAPAARGRWAPARPRRFDPRHLPRGLVQVVGHTGHHKCVDDLGEAWTTAAARAHRRGGIRTLRVAGDEVSYDLGVQPTAADDAALIMIDGELRRVDPAEVALLELARLGAGGAPAPA